MVPNLADLPRGYETRIRSPYLRSPPRNTGDGHILLSPVFSVRHGPVLPLVSLSAASVSKWQGITLLPLMLGITLAARC